MTPLVHPRHHEIIYQAKFEEQNRQRLRHKKFLESLPLDELIQEIFAKKLEYLIKKFFKLNDIPKRFPTDCVINFNVLCRLLCKEKNAVDMLFASRITYSFVHTIHSVTLSFNNLFTGAILCNVDLKTLRELACDEKNQKEHEDYVASKFNIATQAFERHLEESSNTTGHISKKSLLKKALKYNFNAVVLEKLTQDLCEGSKKVSQTCSHLFYLSVVISDFQDPPRFKENSVWHAFTIEQYNSSDQEQSPEDRCSYHIYQSWIGRATVLSDMQERKKTGKWVLSHEYMIKEFLPTLNRILGYNKSDTSNISDLCKSIFGYVPQFKFPKSAWTTDSSRTIGGYSLKYSSNAINPKEVSTKLVRILSDETDIS